MTVVIVVLFALGGADPYRAAIPVMIGLATLGIILLQALAALAIVAYFWRRRTGDVLKTLVAPAIGAIGLLIAAALVVANFRLLTTSASDAASWSA